MPGRPEEEFYKVQTQDELLGIVLARLDERSKQTTQAVERIDKEFREFNGNLSRTYVGLQEFNGYKALTDRRLAMVEKVAFGAVGTICLAVLTAIVALVVTKGG
jgi:hypothetical protein